MKKKIFEHFLKANAKYLAMAIMISYIYYKTFRRKKKLEGDI